MITTLGKLQPSAIDSNPWRDTCFPFFFLGNRNLRLSSDFQDDVSCHNLRLPCCQNCLKEKEIYTLPKLQTLKQDTTKQTKSLSGFQMSIYTHPAENFKTQESSGASYWYRARSWRASTAFSLSPSFDLQEWKPMPASLPS